MPVDLVVCVATELECEILRAQGSRMQGVPLVVTGVGAVNAAYALTRFIGRESPKAVVVCGIGGAYPEAGLEVGDVVCAASEYYGDLGAASAGGFLDMQALGFPTVREPGPLYNSFPLQLYPALGHPAVRKVPFVTVNTCTGDDAAARAIAARTGGAVENMEGAAIAHVAALAGIRAGEIRGISNAVGNRNRADWRVREAAAAAQETLLDWLCNRLEFENKEPVPPILKTR